MPVPDKEGRRQAGGDPSLRSATAADAEFAYLVLEQTMRRHAVATWGAWLESQARAAMTADACAGRSQVIELGTVPVGLLRLDRHATHLQLEQLFVLPAYQRMGMGKRVLQTVFGQARSLGLPIRLRVLQVNPAKGFHARHGFRVVHASAERLSMEWQAPSDGCGP